MGVALRDLDIRYYIPLEEKTHIINGRRVERRTPILGEYVLMKITNRWRETLRLRDVRGLLMDCDDNPAIVLPQEMERLKEFYGDGVYRKPVIPAKTFKYGDPVTPKSGPFIYHIGTYESSKGRSHETAVFKLFGREQKITFKKGDLVSA